MHKLTNFNSNKYSHLSAKVSNNLAKKLKICQKHLNCETGSDIRIKAEIENSRNQIAGLLNADPQMLFFSGSVQQTDAEILINSILYLGIEEIITQSSDNTSKHGFIRNLELSGKVKVFFVEHDSSGRINIRHLSEIISRGNRKKLLTLTHADRINGNLIPVKEIAAICKEKQVFFHLDVNLTIGKYALDLKTLSPDFMSFACNLINGPEGIGGIIINSNLNTSKYSFNLIYKHLRFVEHNNPALISGMEYSLNYALKHLVSYRNKIIPLKKYFIQQLNQKLNIKPLNEFAEKEGLINLIAIPLSTSQFGNFIWEKFNLKGFLLDVNHLSTNQSNHFDLIISIALNAEVTEIEIDKFINYLQVLQNKNINHK